MASVRLDDTTIDTVHRVNSETSSPSVADTFERVRQLLHERYGIDKFKIEMDSELTSLGLDSLSLVECAFDLEEALHVALSDLPHELVTIGDLVRYVNEIRRAGGSSIAA